MAANAIVPKVARVTLLGFIAANLIAATGFVVAISASFWFADMLTAHLAAKYGAGADVPDILLALRSLLILGIIGTIPVHRILRGLLAILATVAGDPFVATNAARLRSIAWILLALQLLDLSLGGFAAWFHALHIDFVGWSPSIGGWIAVLMTFVLAQIFDRGAAMRDDPAMTI